MQPTYTEIKITYGLVKTITLQGMRFGGLSPEKFHISCVEGFPYKVDITPIKIVPYTPELHIKIVDVLTGVGMTLNKIYGR